jgi:two-component system, NtrC family, response regulator AtoC
MSLNALSPEAISRSTRALEARRLASLAAEIPGHWLLDSPGLAGVLDMARRLAWAPTVPVLIEGERGTGVLELARLIHDADPVAQTGRLLSLAANLVSPSDMRGWALDGTLFIEDVENLRPVGQAWVAELLAGRIEAVRPLRIIAGSRLSAGELLSHPGLNQELVHSLDVGRLIIPALRHRSGDILRLARRFLSHYAEGRGRPLLRFSAAAESKLLAHTYPANVRELRNVVERAAALATVEEVGEEAIVIFDEAGAVQSRGLLGRAAAAPKRRGAQLPTMAELERDYLVMLIRELKGRRTEISRAMGVSYPTVLKKISKYGLDVRAIVGSAAAPADPIA